MRGRQGRGQRGIERLIDGGGFGFFSFIFSIVYHLVLFWGLLSVF